MDAVCAMLAAMGIKIIQILFEKIDANEFFTIVICSAFASFFAIFSAYFHFADNMDKVTIG
ncbi:MAG: threonine/serine exporter family protein, partial [Oscillospiraceae bacterium]|nr:threonine/serine exporter family protein [Oscillospiraceae bacterium]